MTKSLKDVVVSLQQSYGEGVVNVGVSKAQIPRLPSGIFPFDLASGGGFPQGKLSIVYGPESSGKTNLCLKTIAMAQHLYPDHACVFLDIENSFDRPWAEALGVDCEKLIHVQPGWGEQAVDLAHQFMMAGDLSLLVIDSLATMVSMKSVDDDAEKAIVGGNAMLIQKLMYKALHDLAAAGREGRSPTVICVNQIRYKVGVMYGDPESMPGGKAKDHMSGLTVRLYSKPVIDKEVHATIPARRETSLILKKHKCPIVNLTAKFEICMLPHNGKKVGEVDDWNTVSAYLKSLGWLRKETSSWRLLDKEFPTIKAIREYLAQHPNVDWNLRRRIIDKETERIYAGQIPSTGPEV